MHRLITLAIGASLSFSITCFGQDEVEIVANPMVPLTAAIPPNPHLLTYQQARDLINQTLQVQNPRVPAYVDDPGFYC
jgi:hypothetical protein